MNRFGKSVPRAHVVDKFAQDWVDAWVLLRSKQHLKEPDAFGGLKGDHLSEFRNEAWSLAQTKELEEKVKWLIDKDVIKLFHSLSIFESSGGRRRQQATKGRGLGLGLSAQPSSSNQGSLHDLIGFELETRMSRIPEAGKGVFVKCGNILPGEGDYLQLLYFILM
jgi:hypothetical protein